MPTCPYCAEQINAGLARCPYCKADLVAPVRRSAVFGAGCVFDPKGSIQIRDITDGTANTLMVGEIVGEAIPWTKPADVDVTEHPDLGDPQGFSSKHHGGCQFLMVDGSVRFVSSEIFGNTFRALCTRAGNEQVLDF